MLDINLLRKDVGAVAERLRSRGFEFDVATFNALEAERKAAQVQTEELQARRNALSKQIGALKSRGEDTTAVMAEAAAIPDQVKRCAGAIGEHPVATHRIVAGRAESAACLGASGPVARGQRRYSTVGRTEVVRLRGA